MTDLELYTLNYWVFEKSIEFDLVFKCTEYTINFIISKYKFAFSKFLLHISELRAILNLYVVYCGIIIGQYVKK